MGYRHSLFCTCFIASMFLLACCSIIRMFLFLYHRISLTFPRKSTQGHTKPSTFKLATNSITDTGYRTAHTVTPTNYTAVYLSNKGICSKQLGLFPAFLLHLWFASSSVDFSSLRDFSLPFIQQANCILTLFCLTRADRQRSQCSAEQEEMDFLFQGGKS